MLKGPMMKKLLIGLALLTSITAMASNTCNIGVSSSLSAGAIAVLEEREYNPIPLADTRQGDLALKMAYGEYSGVISGFFCTTSYQDITLVKKGNFDSLIHVERISSCDNTSSQISNYAKKFIKALKKMPSCRDI